MILKIFIYRIILLIILIITYNLAYADIPFFQDGARSAGMGGAFTALGDDANTIFHNPAGLVYIKKKIFSVSTSYHDYTVHISWLDKWGEDWDYSYYDKRIFVSYIHPTPKFTFGISRGVREKGDDELGLEERTGEGPTGRILYWKDGEKMGIISFGKKLTPELAIGTSLKYVIEEGGDLFDRVLKDKRGTDLDMGFLRQLNDKVSIGLLIQNILKSKVEYIIYDYFMSIVFPERLPRNVNIGISIKPKNYILIAIDVDNLLEDKVWDRNHEVDYTFKRKYQLGTEIQYKNFFIRAGISQHRQVNKFGYIIGKDFDYDKTIIYALGLGFHNKSLKIDLGVTYDKREDEIEKYKTLEVKDLTFRYLVSGSVLF